MKKVLVITYYWPPSGGAGVQRWLKFTRYLPQFGWEPVILTVDPKYASFPQVDRSFEAEVPDDLKVVRTPSREIFQLLYGKKGGGMAKSGFANVDPNSLKQRLAGFIRGHFFVPDPRRGWNRFALKAARKLVIEEDFDLILTTSPPHSTQLIGRKLARLSGLPWVADMRDPWTDIYYSKQLYPGPLARFMNLRLERKIMKEADKLLTVGPRLAASFCERHELSKEKVRVVYNGYDEADFPDPAAPEAGDTNGSGDSHTGYLTYVGSLSDLYPLDSFAEAISEAMNKDADLKLRFVGAISEGHRKALLHLPGDRVEYIPGVEHPRAIRYMLESKALLLIIPDHCSARSILTGKLFEYLATGRPILGIGPEDGDAADILKRTGRGQMTDPKNRDGFTSFFEDLQRGGPLTNIDLKDQTYRDYSRKHLSKELAQILTGISSD